MAPPAHREGAEARDRGAYATVPLSRSSAAPADCRCTEAPPRSLRVAAALLLGGAVVVLALGGLLDRGRLRLRPGRVAVAAEEVLEAYQTGAFQGQCGVIEKNVDYELDWADKQGFGMNFDHIPSPDMCCAMCQGVPQCKAWTWVKDALPDGCPSQCWLKGGLPKTKKPKPGVVSGLPPPRPALDVARVKAPSQAAEGPNSCFCWSLMLPFGGEMELIKMQHSIHASIFACDAYTVYSNKSLTVAPGLETKVVNVDLTVKFGGDSYSALNTWIFIAVWKQVIEDGWHTIYPWVVKVDPDAVFFVDRLRPVLAKHAGVGYINNCRFGLHGPIEVLASSTLKTLKEDYEASWDGKAPKECVKKLHFGQWGEDFFLSQCMQKVYHIRPQTDENLMCEAHCSCKDWYWCADSSERVTYHPFKRADMYKQCMANAMALAP